MEESVSTIIMITLSGGFQDAYSYFARGKVFSNAQTGNIVLMASHLADGDFAGMFRYLIPLAFFSLGVFVAEQIEGHDHPGKNLHWRQKILLCEAGLMFLSVLLPSELNILVTSMLSFACAMQVQTFRKWNGNVYASTMCIGNMRNSMAALSSYFRSHDLHDRSVAFWYFSVNVIFFFGAGIGYLCVEAFGLYAIGISGIMLLIGAACMWNLNLRTNNEQ